MINRLTSCAALLFLATLSANAQMPQGDTVIVCTAEKCLDIRASLPAKNNPQVVEKLSNAYLPACETNTCPLNVRARELVQSKSLGPAINTSARLKSSAPLLARARELVRARVESCQEGICGRAIQAMQDRFGEQRR